MKTPPRATKKAATWRSVAFSPSKSRAVSTVNRGCIATISAAMPAGMPLPMTQKTAPR